MRTDPVRRRARWQDVGMITLPEQLAAATVSREGDAGTDWIDRLPALAEHYLQLWHCSPDGSVTNGAVALIMPVRSPQGRP